MVKKTIKQKVVAKAKVKTGRGRKPGVPVAKLLSEAAINPVHAKALTAASKIAKNEDRAAAAMAKVVAQKTAADARLKAAVATAKTKKSAAAKNAVVKARAAKVAAVAAIKAAKANLASAKAEIKAAVVDVNSAKNREVLKQKAVAAFTAKWEKAYDSKAKKKPVVRRKARTVKAKAKAKADV